MSIQFTKIFEKYVVSEAKKLIARYHSYHNWLHMECERKVKLVGHCFLKEVKKPAYWSRDKKFDPFYVLSNRRSISKSISQKIISGQYSPNSPAKFEKKKNDGGIRNISVYQVPDVAVSNLFFTMLMEKNKHRFSSYAYAYIPDRNAHFAIQDISLFLQKVDRAFIAEYDFSDFFGSMSHKFLEDQFDKNGFFITDNERRVLKSFMNEEGVGVPQGVSTSLFLANLACWELDKKLEGLGVKFARYADDTIICSLSYERMCRAVEVLHEFSEKSGIKINTKKSLGISLLTRGESPCEMNRNKKSFDFLGYKISLGETSIKEQAVYRIKQNIGYIIYKNLVKPLKGEEVGSEWLPRPDGDPAVLATIMQVRRYLYGNLTDAAISLYMSGRIQLLRFKGLMNFYPLLSDEEQLKKLDGWLVATLYNAIQRRKKLLSEKSVRYYLGFPYAVTQEKMVIEFMRHKIKGKRRLAIPSFARVHKALVKKLYHDGIGQIIDPRTDIYVYQSK